MNVGIQRGFCLKCIFHEKEGSKISTNDDLGTEAYYKTRWKWSLKDLENELHMDKSESLLYLVNSVEMNFVDKTLKALTSSL